MAVLWPLFVVEYITTLLLRMLEVNQVIIQVPKVMARGSTSHEEIEECI